MSHRTSVTSLFVLLLAAGSLSAAPTLGAARANHTATLLPNGKVLIAGGTNGGNLSSAELYDPATGVFKPTGSMNAARSSHTATLLPNGKVLIAGGTSASIFVSLDSAELYDPATEVFTPTASMTSPRASQTATLLANGKVLMAGGSGGFTSLQTAELFDPSSGTNGTFTATAAMTAARANHTAVLLASGKVLLSGGIASLSALGSAELFDPAVGANGSFTATPNMNAPRSGHSATALANGKVLIAGGNAATAELFDPSSGANGTFAFTGPMTAARNYHTATLLPNGKVLIEGGKSGAVLASAELYDPTATTFAATVPLTAARYFHTATLLPNGSVLIAAGFNDTAYLNTAQVYEPASGGQFTSTGSMATARINHTSTLLPEGKVLIAGGSNLSGPTSAAELYDPASGTFTPTGATMNSIRSAHTATLLSNGKVLLAGGYLGSLFSYSNTAELYDPAAGTFTLTTATMTSARSDHTATLLPDGKVLLTGGYTGSVFSNTAELYDPATGTFTATGANMNSARAQHTATLLPDGNVLIAGGSNGSALTSAELYDPADGTFTATNGSMGIPRYTHSATLLPGGKVLLFSGYDGAHFRVYVDLYDPATGTFAAGTQASTRGFQTATLLPTGMVLIAGGSNDAGPLETALLYDPASDGYVATGNMAFARKYDRATLLPNGKVLITGGLNFLDFLNTAELFDDGLGYAEARRPVVSSLTNPLCQPANLALSGSLFTGDSEGSSGASNSSATNAPLLRLQRVDNEQLQLALSSSFSASSVFSVTLSNLSSGRYRAAIVSNAIPSKEQIIDVETVPVIGTYSTSSVNVSGSTTVPALVPPAYNGAFYPQTATASGFTGALFVNGATGAVVVSNAGPVGDFAVSVSSTNACGSLATGFTLKVIGPAASLTATAGTPQSTQFNTAFAIALQATITDSVGHPLGNVGVNFTAPPSGASATLPGGGFVMPNASGVASITATANGITGRYNVTATVGAFTGTFDLSNISPGTPTNVVATAQTTTSVLIVWSGPVVGATYEVQRLASGNVSSTVGSSSSGSLTDSAATANTAYLYEVREISPAVSTYGTADLATTVIFTDPSLPLGNLAAGIELKPSHFTQLRTAVEAVRALAGLGGGSYSDPTLTGGTTTVKRAHLTELRAALDEARTALLLPSDTYARPAIVANTTSISAGDLNELRGGVR